MSDDWVYRRFERFKAARAAEEQKQLFQTNALNSASSKFHDLKERIAKDVSEYNRLFSSHNGCKAELRANQGDPKRFQVESPQGTVDLSLNGGTVISLQYSLKSKDGEISKRLEIAPDPDGNIVYRFDDALLKDVSEVSEKILDKILC